MRAPLCSWAPPHAAQPRGAATQELKSSGAARLPNSCERHEPSVHASVLRLESICCEGNWKLRRRQRRVPHRYRVPC